MVSKLTKQQWIDILTDETICKPKDIQLFQAIYSFDNHESHASQVAPRLGYKGKAPHRPINLQIGQLAKRIAKKYDIDITRRKNLKFKYWDLFFVGREQGKFWMWKLKKPLAEAIRITGLNGEAYSPEELPPEQTRKLPEGMKYTITINLYERNPQTRAKCIEYCGTRCSVCNFDFRQIYGDLGKGFIHIHHLKPISEIGKKYEVDPKNDLRPICPNCHAMIHRETPALTIEQLWRVIKQIKKS
jgi:5-methylcytosine-specific restriction protein A